MNHLLSSSRQIENSDFSLAKVSEICSAKVAGIFLAKVVEREGPEKRPTVERLAAFQVLEVQTELKFERYVGRHTLDHRLAVHRPASRNLLSSEKKLFSKFTTSAAEL